MSFLFAFTSRFGHNLLLSSSFPSHTCLATQTSGPIRQWCWTLTATPEPQMGDIQKGNRNCAYHELWPGSCFQIHAVRRRWLWGNFLRRNRNRRWLGRIRLFIPGALEVLTTGSGHCLSIWEIDEMYFYHLELHPFLCNYSAIFSNPAKTLKYFFLGGGDRTYL